MRRLVAECWDRLNPAIESEDDLEVRAAPFYWLDEPDRGARFPNTLRQVPMVWGEGGRYGWLQWKQSQSGKDGISPADIEKAIQATPREHCQAMVDDLTESLAGARHPGQGAQRQDGAVRPGVHRPAPGRGRMPGAGPADPPDARGRTCPSPARGRATARRAARGRRAEAGSFLGRQVASRAQVYQQLAQAAALLQQLEPHSPIPYLINRAVELGALSFPDLMRQLIRDSDVLTAMNRELGIKEPSRDD